MSSCGAMVAYSGKRTGRSPKDKRVVKDALTENDIWWGNVNIPISPKSHALVETIVRNYLNTRPRLYVVDGYVGWDAKYRKKIRIICSRVYHALFMRNMLIVPTAEELVNDFNKGVDFTVLNGGELLSTDLIEHSGSETCVSVNLAENRMAILGS